MNLYCQFKVICRLQSKFGMHSVDSSHAMPALFGFNSQQIRNATKKAGGTVKNSKDSNPKYLGLKKSGGQRVIPGNIIVRQRGLKYGSGPNTGLGRDYTIWALTEGYVKFTYDKVKKKQNISVEAEFPYKQKEKKTWDPISPWLKEQLAIAKNKENSHIDSLNSK